MTAEYTLQHRSRRIVHAIARLFRRVDSGCTHTFRSGRPAADSAPASSGDPDTGSLPESAEKAA